MVMRMFEKVGRKRGGDGERGEGRGERKEREGWLLRKKEGNPNGMEGGGGCVRGATPLPATDV